MRGGGGVMNDEPNILAVPRAPGAVDRSTIGNDDGVLARGPLQGIDDGEAGGGGLALLAGLPQRAEVFEVALRHAGHVLAVEHADLEVPHPAVPVRRVPACRLQPLQRQVH